MNEPQDTEKPKIDLYNARVARAFLLAYWNADLATALGYCAPDSIIELSRSIPILTPAPASVVLPLMFRDIYTRFKEERFETQITSVLADCDRVLIEYTARGLLATDCEFSCDYAIVFWIQSGLIVRLRAYADTRYIAPLLTC